MNSAIDFPPLPSLMTTGRLEIPQKNTPMITSSSDPLAGPSTQYNSNIHQDNKTSESVIEDSMEEDKSSDIIANAPRLSSSRYAPRDHQFDAQSIQADSQAQKPLIHGNNSQLPAEQKSTIVKEQLYIARDYIVKAYNVSQNRTE